MAEGAPLSRGAPAGPDDARLLDREVVLPAEEEVATAARRLEALDVAAEGDDARPAATDPWGPEGRLRAGSSPAAQGRAVGAAGTGAGVRSRAAPRG